MFKLRQGDYELIFEYDTVEELKEILEATKMNRLEIMEKSIDYKNAQIKLETSSKTKEEDIKWSDLELKFVEVKRNAGKVSKATYKAYASTFNKLNEFFGKKLIANLTIEDYEKFRDFLKSKYKLKNKTINKHIIYVNNFLEFAISRKILDYNPVKALESLAEEKVEKENYTDEEINRVLSYDYEPSIALFFKIAIYSGMRLHEIHNLTKDDIKQTEGIYYFDIKKSKSSAGVRKVPIHNSILQDVLGADLPLLKDKTTDATQKVLNRQLHKVIPKGGTKTFHTFRATFISKAVNAYPQNIVAIQEIVGHSKNEKDKLTLDTYAKGFSLQLKQQIVNSVSY